METRAQTRGAPLKKEGAYDTDKYYQEKDQGYGDVGVDQEPDAGRTQAEDKKADPDFKVTAAEERAAEAAAREPVEADAPLAEDVADLKAGPMEGEAGARGAGGGPVPIVPTSREEVEQQEVMETPE